MRKFDTESRFRVLSGRQSKLITVLAVLMSCFHFYTSGFGLLPAQNQGAVHLAFALVLTVLLYPTRQSSDKRAGIPWYDFIIAALCACATLYLVVNHTGLAARAGLPTDVDLFMGFLLIILLLEATRRISNPVLSILAVITLLYCRFGRFLPEAMQHRGFGISRIINHMYLGTEGIFGTPLEVSSTFVFMFILFGAVLEKTGMGKFIIDLSLALAGWSTGGPAKVAVVASGLMGTVSGSSVANVCTTGMFTIPLMKSVGYRPHFAGAVEAVASTGGQIMPPVMGAGAFIMAQFLGESYTVVAVAAVVPALLYYTAVMVQVHFEARRLGLKGIAREHLPSVRYLLRTRGFLLLPLAAIVYFLLTGYTPLMAAFYGIITCIALSWLNRETRLTPRKLAEAFESGARSALSVACACACVGLIVGTGTLTGLALRIANGIITLSGGMLLPTLLLTMFACILLGTGLPTTANFIVTSAMAAPALLQLGVPPIAAYMFVFYFGIAADITPPVALAAYAGAGIAGADPMRTGVTAFKLALAGLLVPYIYVFNPILLFVDATPLPMLQAVVTALIGVFLLAMCSIGFYRTTLPLRLRAAALIGALGLLDPGTATDILGLVILVVIHVTQTLRAKREASAGTQP
ncbi:MAG: TRAP transporter permease [Desulfovibrio sp.]|nr:TRAP transporter permease [Desulfovibrio sp.]